MVQMDVVTIVAIVVVRIAGFAVVERIVAVVVVRIDGVVAVERTAAVTVVRFAGVVGAQSYFTIYNTKVIV